MATEVDAARWQADRDYYAAMRRAEKITDPGERAAAEEKAGFEWFCTTHPKLDI